MAKQKKLSKIEETNMDLLETLDVVEKLNARIYELEMKLQNQVKLYNMQTNTINYILASLYVYESYFTEMGVDQDLIQKEIEHVYYDAFNKTNKRGKLPEYSTNIIKKVNDKLREFQEKLNEDK